MSCWRPGQDQQPCWELVRRQTMMLDGYQVGHNPVPWGQDWDEGAQGQEAGGSFDALAVALGTLDGVVPAAVAAAVVIDYGVEAARLEEGHSWSLGGSCVSCTCYQELAMGLARWKGQTCSEADHCGSAGGCSFGSKPAGAGNS